MTASQTLLGAFSLAVQYQDYVWGGTRLRPGQRTAEAWVVYEENKIKSGPLAGHTLKDAAAELGPTLLGSRVVKRMGNRFPLLVKLLDCAQWLSLQVHPNDEQAGHLEGAGHYGKTEAWHVLEANPGAEILCGFTPGAAGLNWRDTVGKRAILDITHRIPVRPGETYLIRAGTLHALGPGLLIYEIQQTSDITYRVYDWDRPPSEGRKLHIEQSRAVLDPSSAAEAFLSPPVVDGAVHPLVACPYFNLDLFTLEGFSLPLTTRGRTFHLLTVIEGQVRLQGRGWQQVIDRYETALVPAASGSYLVHPRSQTRILKASVEE